MSPTCDHDLTPTLSPRRSLQQEYDRLKQAHREHVIDSSAEDGPGSGLEDGPDRDTEMIQEAKLLRQHKGRLEARMGILEDHNRQLEAQLQRLRQLLEQVRGCGFISPIGVWL